MTLQAVETVAFECFFASQVVVKSALKLVVILKVGSLKAVEVKMYALKKKLL